MFPILLCRTKTKDGISLDGMYVPPRRKSKTALIWVHGLGSNFSSGQTLTQNLSRECSKRNIGYFRFNTRGHDLVTWGRKRREYLGAGFEKFEDSIKDIRTMIEYAKTLGYRSFFLAGHSTGANKVVYYLYKTRDPRIKSLLLFSPVSDIAGAKKVGPKDIARGLLLARKLMQRKGHGLMPSQFGMYSPKRFWSLFHPEENEDVFPYYNKQAKWKAFGNITVPIFVAIGSRDEYLERTRKSFLQTFHEKSRHPEKFKGVEILGAGHSFIKREKILVRAIVQWIKKEGFTGM